MIAVMRWFKSAVRHYTVLSAAADTDTGSRLTEEERGNVTPAHREVLKRLALASEKPWSGEALWACLEELRHSTITEAAEVRIEQAWIDGSEAFCIIYTPPYQPEELVGLRRHAAADVIIDYGLGSTLYLQRVEATGTDSLSGGVPNPIAFGVAVAAFDIGEPLGAMAELLRTDDQGVGWWGSLEADLPGRAI